MKSRVGNKVLANPRVQLRANILDFEPDIPPTSEPTNPQAYLITNPLRLNNLESSL